MQWVYLYEASDDARRFDLHLVDATDLKSPEPGEAAGTKPDISIRGGAYTPLANALTAVDATNGDYTCRLTPAEVLTYGIGNHRVRYLKAGVDYWSDTLYILPWRVWDDDLGIIGPFDSNVISWLGSPPLALASQLVQASITGTPADGLSDAFLSRILTLTAYPERSVGRRLYQMDLTLDEGTAQAGTADSITLATTAPGDLRLVGGLIDTTGGTGAFQSRLITSYDAVSHKATIAPAWAIVPDATTTYRVSSHSQTIALSAQGTAVTLALTASDTAIANRSLRRLGQPPVTALDGATPTSAVLRDLYPGTRDALIADTKPRFARDRANLAEDAVYAALTSKIGFTHRYPVPADYLAPVGLGSEEAPLPDPYVEEGGAILTDVGAPLPLRYVKRVTDASTFSAEFVDVFALFLAAEACYPITNSNTRTADLRAEGEQRRAWLRHAESVKATSPKRGDEDSLTRNRGG